MERLRVDGSVPDPSAVARAVAVLESGRLLIYPTDTLYALGGRALDAAVVARVRAAKARAAGKPLPLVAADADQVRGLCAAWPDAARLLARRFWPGPLTLVLPAARHVPSEVTAGGATIAVRVPALAVTRALCVGVGALVSTSANLAGEAAPMTCDEAVAAVGAKAALALDAGPGNARSSTIVDLSSDAPRLLRAGPVAWDEIVAVLGAC